MKPDGIHAMVAYEDMSPGAKKMRDFYALKPDAGIFQKEFGYYSLDLWKSQGHLKPDVTPEEIDELFGFDPPGKHSLGGLGWCEGGFCPVFEEKVLEDSGEYELVQDFAGRSVKYFKNRRQGFMPEYVDHPVKDMKTWEEKCKWRMDPKTPERYEKIKEAMPAAIAAAGEGQVICQ